MLKCNPQQLQQLEKRYSGITETILAIESLELPKCPQCNSENIAQVATGAIGRTIHIAASTTRFKLSANGAQSGDHFCNACIRFFNICPT